MSSLATNPLDDTGPLNDDRPLDNDSLFNNVDPLDDVDPLGGVNFVDGGQAQLVDAATRGDVALLRQIYSARDDWTSDSSRTELRRALQGGAAKGAISVVCQLIEWGADLQPGPDDQSSALFEAVGGQHMLVVKELLTAGANPNWHRPIDGFTALFIAVMNQSPHMINLLVEAGGDINGRSQFGESPLLHAAAMKGKGEEWSTPTFASLLKNGADINAADNSGVTALHWAAQNRNSAFVKVLVAGVGETKADIHAKTNGGFEALYFAAEEGAESIVEFLLENGADVHAVGDGGWTALHAAAHNGHLNVTRQLLDAGADINARPSNGIVPLKWAALGGHREIVELFLDHPKVKLDVGTISGLTPLPLAADEKSTDIAIMLSRAQAIADLKLLPAAEAACRGFETTVVEFYQFCNDTPERVLKQSVYNLLYSWHRTPKKPRYTPTISERRWRTWPNFRWIHLPANNVSILVYRKILEKSSANNLQIAWAEALIDDWSAKQSHGDFDTFQALRSCFDQEQRGQEAHQRAMMPFFQRIVPPSSDTDDIASGLPTDPGREGSATRSNIFSETGPAQRSFVLFVSNMPFLHYEVVGKHHEMQNAVKLASSKGFLEKGKDLPDKSKDSPDKGTPDTLLLKGYIHHRRPLQIRRTLDQYLYSSGDTSSRDKDQVVLRYCKKHGLEPKMLMVDQLWLWVLGNGKTDYHSWSTHLDFYKWTFSAEITADLVISCFPERWGRPKDDPLNVLGGILDAVKVTGSIKSPHHLASIIFSHCCNAFDRKSVDLRHEFLGMFENSIASIISRQTELLQKFNQATKESTRWLKDRKQRGMGSMTGEHDTVLDSLLGLADESAILTEIDDIRDELNIIQTILDTQTELLKEMSAAVAEEYRLDDKAIGNALQYIDPSDLVKMQWQTVQRQLDTRQRDLQRMDRRAESVYTSLRTLLDLKQMQSNALEAKFSRDQAISASKQGQAVLIFTVVTIVFLPVSFIATLFTINLDVWSTPLELSYVFKYIFGIGLGISIPLVIMALTVADIKKALVWFVLEITGFLTNQWKRDPSTKEQVMA